MTGESMLHKSLRLHVTPDRYYVEACGDSSNEILVVDRVSQEISLLKSQPGNKSQIPVAQEIKNIDGVLGTIRLLAGNYLIVVTRKSKVGELDGHFIWKVEETEVLSYKRTHLHLTEIQVHDNRTYLSMIQQVLSTDGFYFSYTYDLTHTLQRLYNTSPDFVHMSFHERGDQRFVWNTYLLRELVSQPELNSFALPIMHGFCEIKSCVVSGVSLQYTLVSRRSCLRAGVRYYMRGIDSEGHAANYIETEQIVMCDGHRFSFVQTRGSCPFFWSQRPNLKYKPIVELNSNQRQVDGYQRHFENQIYNYGKQFIINLLDNKGVEKVLVENYNRLSQSSDARNVRYIWFDFHYECRQMRWDRLSILIDKLVKDQNEFGYFMMSGEGIFKRQQEGVFRTNCIDCLDRTNVVQSLLARLSLQDQLRKLGVLKENDQLADEEEFECMFKNVWADNANACSIQYTGTPALKTDYTRTGKRTKWGLLRDGYNSAVRYVKNNFSDGYRQDSIDLFLGNHIVEESEGVAKPSPFHEPQDRRMMLIPIIFLICVTMFVFSLLIPAETYSEQLLYVAFWGAAAVGTMFVVLWYGQEFVDRPKLAQKAKTE